MEIVKPQVELWVQDDPIVHIARCARICYASDKTTGNEAMYQRLIDSNHKSMFRHQSVYYIIPYKGWRLANLQRYEECPYLEFKYDCNYIYVSTNKQFVMKHNAFTESYREFEVDGLQFENTPLGFELMRYTFRVVTQISTSRELNRVSPNNIAEQSTRYVDFGKKGGITICLPHWWDESSWFKKLIYKSYWKSCEIMYNLALRFGMKAQDAREFLPLCTATKCVYTYSVDEWQHILDLRFRGVTGKPHPNAKVVATEIAVYLDDFGYNIKTLNCQGFCIISFTR